MTPHQAWLAAEAAYERNDFTGAERLYRNVLSLEPRHVPALIGISTVLSKRNAHREAWATTLAAYEARVPVAPLIYAIAQRLRYFHEFARLSNCLAAPEFAATAPPDIIAKASVMLSSIGENDAAAKLVDKALAREPGNSAALHCRGNYYHFSGEADRAEACYERSLLSDPQLFQNYMMLSGLRKQTPEKNHVERLAALLDKVKSGDMGEVYLSFAMHRELNDLGRHDEAWAALAHGCRIRRSQLHYRHADTVDLVRQLKETCNAGFFQQCSAVGQPATPIFIVGMHRSGTTLLERMLAGHSLVGDAGETSSFHAQVELAIDHASPEGMDAAFVRRAAGADFDAVARGYANSARWLSRGNPYFTEKLPQNFFNVGFIAKAIPQARFLHLVRDPVDTCFSNLRTLFARAALYSYDQQELGNFFLQYRAVMEHWRQVLPGRVLDISYDDLVGDPTSMAVRIAEHCGLRFEKGMVDIGRSSGSISTPSAAVARQGFRKDRGRAWEPYEQHLGPLRQSLAELY